MAYGKQYVGSYAAMDPGLAKDYGELFTGYQLPHKRIGVTTSIQTINQVAEVEARLKEGVSTIEMGTMDPRYFEQIAKQQFDEMRRLAKLANAEVTVHAPVIDPSGFTERDWNQQAKEEAERNMLGIVKKAHALNPEGNVPVTFHASAVLAEDWQSKVGDIAFGKPVKNTIVMVNRYTGEISPVKGEEMIYPGQKPEYYSPERRIESVNTTEWDNHLVQVQNMMKAGDEIMESAPPKAAVMTIYKALEEGKIRPEQLDDEQKTLLKDYGDKTSAAALYYQDAATRFRTIYEWASKYKDERLKKEELEATQAHLENISNIWTKNVEEKRKLLEGKKFLDPFSHTLIREKDREMIKDSLREVSSIDAPRMHVPITEFALEKAPETIANVTWQAYKEFKETTPIIAMENVIPSMVFSRADQLIQLVKESRKKFVANAVAGGMNTDKAEKTAEKLIGATWDIAHINMLRGKGFKEEEIKEETRKIAPYIKKVHIADNFGMEHSDLPPGMGTVPIKDLMEIIGKSGFKGKAIVEAGSWVGAMKTSAHPYSLEALGSPIYSPAESPVWGQAMGTYGSASMGYGPIFPEQHFSMYGAGFSSLPVSLGGQVPGKQSRFSGAPIE